MDVQASPPSVDQSLENDGDPLSKIDEPEIGEEEEDQFYDAGENGALNSSDVTPSDLNFSVANEDLSTDGSNLSEQNTPTLVPRQKRQTEPTLDNLDDISTEGPSSVDGSNSPRHDKAQLIDDNEVPEESANTLSSTSEHNGEAESQAASSDAVHQSSDDLSQDKADESEIVPSREDTPVNVANSSKSSMEVMDDELDSHSSKRSSPETVVPNSDTVEVNLDTVIETSVENSTEKDIETNSKNDEPPDSAIIEKDKTVPETSEILTMDDSDVDESLQENLDVAIKVVEESQSSSAHPLTTEASDAVAEPEDGTNNENLSEDIASKSENILEEFQEDAAKINGDSSELLDSRLSPCQVVLFRIDFDENALKYLKQKTDPLQLSDDCNTDSTSDTLFSKTTTTDSNFDSSSKSPSSHCNSDDSFLQTPANLSSPKRRILTKAARKMIPSPRSIKKTISPRARNSRASTTSTNSTNSESTRPRRNTRNATIQGSNLTYSDSLNSDDEAPLTSPSPKCKAVPNGTRRSGRSVKKLSYPISSPRGDCEEAENVEKELSIGISGEKTLKCVSIPIITDIIKLLGKKSCSELIVLINQKEDKLLSQITKSKLNENTTTKRLSRKCKMSSSDTSNSSAGDSDYKTYGKMWKYDDGTSREDNSFSLRSESNSTSNKRSSRQSMKVQNYTEDSRSDDECPQKKAKTGTRNSSRVKRNEKQDTNSDDETAVDSPKAKSMPNKRGSRTSTRVQNYVEASKSADESTAKSKKTRRENSTHAESNEKNNTDSDEEKTEDLPKAKSTTNKRSSRKKAKVQYVVKNSESDESPLTKKTSRRKVTHIEHDKKKDTDSDEEKSEDLPKVKSASSKRSSRKRGKVLNYNEDSESDDESPLKKETREKKLSHVKHGEKNDTNSDDKNAEDLPKVKSPTNKRSSRTSAKALKYVEDSESDDKSPLEKETSEENLTNTECSEKNSDSDDEKLEDSPKAKSTLSKRSSRNSAKERKYCDDSESDNKSSLEKETSSENLTHTDSSEKNIDSDDEKTENSPKADLTLNKRSSRIGVKVPKYVEDSESDDKSSSEEATSKDNSTEEAHKEKNGTNSNDEEAEDSPTNSSANKRSCQKSEKKYVESSESDDETTLKKVKMSRRNSSHSDSEDEKAEDSSSEIDNQSSSKRNGMSSSGIRIRT